MDEKVAQSLQHDFAQHLRVGGTWTSAIPADV